MANKRGHRRFGNVRHLQSGRYQIRYRGPDGRMRTGTETYERKGDAERALTLIEAQLLSREWTDPVGGKIKLRDYAQRWLAHRAGLRARTIELYSWLLRTHIAPYLGGVPIGNITPELVREWRATLLGSGVSASAAAKAYRLLRAVLMTAAEDRIIPRNPCRIKGGATRSHPRGQCSRSARCSSSPTGWLRSDTGR
jgi:Phage integrase, N-terminal SAM-like domain